MAKLTWEIRRSSRTLSPFVKNEFPANHYALILSNHGEFAASPLVNGFASSPAKYILWDQTSNDQINSNDRLYVGEVTHGSDGLTEADSVDVLGLDTGFMGTVETAYQFRWEDGKFRAKYMVASPAAAVPEGWDYQLILGGLGDASELTPEDLAMLPVDTHRLRYGYGGPDDITMSAYDLRVIQDVKTAFDALAGAIGQNPRYVNGNGRNPINDLRGYVNNGGPYLIEYFDDRRGIDSNRTLPSNWLQTPLFDLYAFTEKLQGIYDLKTLAEDLGTKVQSCVVDAYANIYKRSNGQPVQWPFNEAQNGVDETRNGLAFFFPDGTWQMHYRSQWWYTARETEFASSWPTSYRPPNYHADKFYGKLDFCEAVNEGNTFPDNWRELLELWYDRGNQFTPGSH